MTESKALESEDSVLTLEETPVTEETCVRVFYTTRDKQANESDSAMQPLLQHKHPDSRDENHKADTQTATDGSDQTTSVPQELELAGGREQGCSGSVRSLCSDSSQHECPICSELFDSHGDHRVTLLNCNHALCAHCIASIMRRAKDQSRVHCPLCRQTTPLPQWEIRRLQEESYSNSVYEPGPALVFSPSPELQDVPALLLDSQRNTCGCCIDLMRGLRLMRPHSLSITALLLLSLLLLAGFLYMVAPFIMLSMYIINGWE